MEVSGGGVVFRSIPSTFSGAGAAATHSQYSSSFLGVSGSRFNADLRLNRTTTTNTICARKFLNSGFGDKGHIDYYYSSTMMIRCGGTGTATAATSGKKKEKEKEKEKEEDCSSTIKTKKKKQQQQQLKKKIKLLKGLSEDLSVFSDLGFGLAPDHGLVAQVKGKMISDAAELLLAQLQKLKAEEKELKRKKKEDKAELKAARMQNRLGSSSSSSSESSDSECGEVVDMGRLKTQSSLAPPVLKELQEEEEEEEEAILTVPNTLLLPKEGSMTEVQPAIVVIREEAGGSTTTPLPIVRTQKHEEEMGFGAHSTSQILEQECSTSCSKRSALGSSDGCNEGSNLLVGAEKKIEVCMGGKCKKSGAPALLEEFQRMVGVEGAAVVGCKCMGKCRDGPNVRVVLNQLDSAAQADDDSVRTPPSNSKHPLCIGVGLEDVGLILSNFFGEEAETGDIGGLAAAS